MICVSRVRLMWAWGPSTSPTACAPASRRCALSAWRKGVPGGAAFRRCEGRLSLGAPPPPAARPPGGLLGSAKHLLCARVCGCGSPALSPWRACPVRTACRGVGGGPFWGGWPATFVRGIWCQALSLPRRPVLWGGQTGSATAVSRVRLLCAWGPGTGPRACGLASHCCAPWQWRKGVPGAGAFCPCEGRLRSGAPPPATVRPLGGLSGSATHVLWARACRCGGPALSPWLAYPVRAACRRIGWGAVPGGGGLPRCEGRLVSGAVSPPAARPLWRAAKVPRSVCPGCGLCGLGEPACALASRRCALRQWRKGVLGGVAFRYFEGCLGSGAPPPPAACPIGGLSGSATHVLGAQVCGCGTPALVPWLACPVGGCAPRGWWGASGFRRPPSLAPRPLCGLPGPAGHVLWARVSVCAVCLWCLCGVCRGACCCPSSIRLVPPSPVPCCGVVLAACLPCSLPRACPSLGCCLPPVSFVVSSFFTLFSTLRSPVLLLGTHFFSASALVVVSVLLLACFLGAGSRVLFFLSCWVL